MSRFNNRVSGPTSALTEFLRASGITPTTVANRAATRNQDATESSPTRRASTSQTGRRRGRRDEASGYASDQLDEPETNVPTKKQKTGKGKATAKKNAKDKDEEDEEDDSYKALSKSMWTNSSTPKPKVGSFANCPKCEKQFTVTKYTVMSGSGEGWLCHVCAKASGSDPFKKPAPKKRKPRAEKRTVTHFEERRLPSLVSLCVQIISRHVNDIEAFGDIGANSMESISKAISKNRSLTPENAHLFYGAENMKLSLYDVTKLDNSAFITLGLLNPNLRSLRLDYCGRIMDDVLESWATHLPQLTSLELLGPFLIRPNAWISFFESHPSLESFIITQSPRFDIECISALAKNCAGLRKLGLREIGQMSDNFLTIIQEFGQLSHLDISSPTESCTDEAVVELLSVIGHLLVTLDLSGHVELTDSVLKNGIAPHTPKLTSLALSHLPFLTDTGVAEFFSGWETSATLTSVNLSRNSALSTQALTALLNHSGETLKHIDINGWKETSSSALSKIGSLAKDLRTIDLGWCREVDDFVVRDILEGCKASLKEIKVWGCNRVEGKWTLNGRRQVVIIHGVESDTRVQG